MWINRDNVEGWARCSPHSQNAIIIDTQSGIDHNSIGMLGTQLGIDNNSVEMAGTSCLPMIKTFLKCIPKPAPLRRWYICLMSTAENTILGLKLPTDPRWTNLAAISLEEVLTDHAFCEQKAATQGISIIQRYAHYPGLVAALAPIVTEEWGHFRMVYAELQKRGYTLGRQRKDEYVNALLTHVPKDINPDQKLMHQLLVCALIEARSCERFRLLSEGLEDEGLRKFYYKFMVSEAGHYRLFLDLSERYFGEDVTRAAWQSWLRIEADILKGLVPRGDRMH